MSPEEVAAHLAERGAWHYSRASGPGGQRRDHAETRAELTIRAAHLEGLPPDVADRLRERWASTSGRCGSPARPSARASATARRSSIASRRRAAAALAPPPPRRRPTRPGRGARERRLADKARRAQIKAGRQPPEAE